MSSLPPSTSLPPFEPPAAPGATAGWRAPPGCPEHVRYTLERAVNAYPAEWLEEPISGEVFDSVNECQERLVAYSLSQGFDIIVTNSATKPAPRATYCCTHHGEETRNWRKLSRTVERDEDGSIVSDRQREHTHVRQTGCKWSCTVSYKSIGKRGSGIKGYILTVKSTSHNGHPLTPNPLVYQRHRERLDEYQKLRADA